MLQKSSDAYDVIVVGSGASGGWAAKRLSEAGLKIALVDAGRPHGANSFREHTPAFALPGRNRTPELMRRTRPIQAGAGCDEFNQEWNRWFPADPPLGQLTLMPPLQRRAGFGVSLGVIATLAPIDDEVGTGWDG